MTMLRLHCSNVFSSIPITSKLSDQFKLYETMNQTATAFFWATVKATNLDLKANCDINPA